MMQKILFTILTLFSFSLHAADLWQYKWAESISLLKDSKFVEAEVVLDAAISLLETEGVKDHPYLYVDRARLEFLVGKTGEALKDLQEALSREELKGHERLRAVTTKIMVNGSLGRFETLSEDLKEFQGLVNLPRLEMKQKKIILRDAPKSDYYKKLISCYLIHVGLSYDQDEVSFLQSNIMLAETHCGCPNCMAEYSKKRKCDICKATIIPTKENCSVGELVEALVGYCGSHVHQLDDQIACLKAACLIAERSKSIELFPDTFDLMFQDIETQPVYWD